MSQGESKQLDSTTFSTWHREYSSNITAFVFGILREKATTEEVVQATFTKAFTVGGEVQPGSEKAWLFQVAYREALMLLRKRKSHQNKLLNIQNQTSLKSLLNDNPVQKILNDEQIEAVQLAVRRLQEKQRDIVHKRIYEEKTFQQIADELQIPLGTALTRMRTALRSLQAVLEQNKDD